MCVVKELSFEVADQHTIRHDIFEFAKNRDLIDIPMV